MEPSRFAYESMGTHWAISIWDPLSTTELEAIQREVIALSTDYDNTYSRFIKTSLIWELTKKQGIVHVPKDLVVMLRMYETMNVLSHGKLNPLVGFSLSDLGYDADYTLIPKDQVRSTPDFQKTIQIIDDEHINIHAPVLIDVGALGKGYFVDIIARLLRTKGMKKFLVDGSGDIFYQGNGEPLRVGLEHPDDPKKVIGVIEILEGGLCGSGSNRRKWHTYHHILDPQTLVSPPDIIAAWVLAENAAIADGLATCVFLADPALFEKQYSFEYCVLNSDYKVNRSSGFNAELF